MENPAKPVTNTPESLKTPTTQKPSRAFNVILFLLFVLLALASGALWHRLVDTQKTLTNTQKNVSALLAEQKTSATVYQKELTALSQKMDLQQKSFSQINDSVSALDKRLPNNDSVFKTAEIIYLVRMANLSLKIQHDVPGALLLLKQAESRFSTFQAPALENFHAALLKNIASLQVVPLVDIDAISTQLGNLQNTVPSLSILVAPKPDTSILENTPHQAHKNWWKRAWDNIKASFQQLVIVRHQDEKIPALMTPEQQLYLQENLQLLLMQAQWALLNHNNALYQKNLKQVKSWVEKYYVQNSAATQEFLKQIENLMDQNISPLLPDLAQTLSLAHLPNA